LKILEVIQKVKDVHGKTTASEIVVGTGNCSGMQRTFCSTFLSTVFVAVGAFYFPLTRCYALGIENLLVELWFLIT